MSTSALAESNPDVSNMSRMVLVQVHFAGYGSYDEFIGVVLPTMPQPSVRFAIRKMAMSFELPYRNRLRCWDHMDFSFGEPDRKRFSSRCIV